MHCAYLDRSLQDNLWWLADDVSGRNLYRRIVLMNKLLSSTSTLSWSSLGIVGGRGICGRKFDLESNFTLGMRWKTRVTTTTTTRPNLVTKLFICRDCHEGGLDFHVKPSLDSLQCNAFNSAYLSLDQTMQMMRSWWSIILIQVAMMWRRNILISHSKQLVAYGQGNAHSWSIDKLILINATRY